MAGRGPTPRPNHLKVLAGSPAHRIGVDVTPSDANGVYPPHDLTPDAAKIWARLAPDLIAQGVLTAWDVDLFASYCQVVAIYQRCVARNDLSDEDRTKTIKIIGPEMRALGAKFGLTPGDRRSLSSSKTVQNGVAARLIT